MSKKNNKDTISINELKSYTTTIIGKENNHLDIYKDACNRFLNDSLENIFLKIEKQNIQV